MAAEVPAELAPILGWVASIAATVGVTVWAQRTFGARDKAEEVASTKLDRLLDDVASVKSELRVIGERMSGHAAEVVEVKARVEGISTNYGGRLRVIEDKLTELSVLLTKRRR